MRLKGIKSTEEGNRFLKHYLPAYAKRFAVQPANDTDLHRPVLKRADLDAVFCVKTIRVLRNDFTVAYNGKLYQIEDNVNAEKETVEEGVNGSIHISYRNTNLRFKEITTRPKKQEQEPQVPKERYIPPRTSSWRRFRLPGSPRFEVREEALQVLFKNKKIRHFYFGLTNMKTGHSCFARNRTFLPCNNSFS